MVAAFIHGFILAFGLIMPLGVQNFYIFTQGAVHKRYAQAVPIVITACICDTILILLAVFGVSLAIMSFVWLKTVLIAAGVLFLAYMGYVSWRSKPATSAATGADKASLGKAVSFTLMISLLNPHAILDTVGVIGTSSLNYVDAERIAFTAACVFVSWSWFFALSLAGRFIGMKDKSGRFIGRLNKISAVVMWAAAIYMIYSF